MLSVISLVLECPYAKTNTSRCNTVIKLEDNKYLQSEVQQWDLV